MFRMVILITWLLVGCDDQSQLRTDHQVLDEQRARVIDYRVWSSDVSASSAAEKKPLVLISHGSGGEFGNHEWLARALVEHGYLVAALNHPLNTTSDNTPEGVVSVWERPADVSVVLTDILENQNYQLVDQTKIGVAGFSSGGYTAIALAGGIFSPALMTRYCSSDDHGPDCELGASADGVDFSQASESYRDSRFRSVFAMAPALGPGVSTESLEAIEIPVFITASDDDELVFPRFGAQRYFEKIPSATLSLIPKGGHFVFLECNAVTTVADYFIKEFDLCGRQFNVDQDEIRRTVAQQAVGFFDQTL